MKKRKEKGLHLVMIVILSILVIFDFFKAGSFLRLYYEASMTVFMALGVVTLGLLIYTVYLFDREDDEDSEIEEHSEIEDDGWSVEPEDESEEADA